MPYSTHAEDTEAVRLRPRENDVIPFSAILVSNGFGSTDSECYFCSSVTLCRAAQMYSESEYHQDEKTFGAISSRTMGTFKVKDPKLSVAD